MSDFEYKSVENFMSDIKDLTSEMMELAKLMAKTKIEMTSDSGFNLAKKSFLRNLLNHLNQYHQYLLDVQSHIRDINVDVYCDRDVMDFNAFKDIIYAKYDYPKILLFTNDLMDLLNNGNANEEDVYRLREDSIMKTFSVSSTSIGSLLEEFRSLISIDLHPSTPLDVQNLKVLSNLQIGDNRDIKWIYDSIEKSLDAFVYGDPSNPSAPYNAPVNTVFIAIITLAEYVSFIATLYTTRIMYVSEFAKSFESGEEEIEESVDKLYDFRENDTKVCAIFHTLDDPYMVRPVNFKKSLETIQSFLEMIKAKRLEQKENGTNFPYTYDRKDFEGTKLFKELNGNLLFNEFPGPGDINFSYTNPRSSEELADRLKSFMYTDNFGLHDSSFNVLNELLNTISTSNYNDFKTIPDIRNYAYDLACVYLGFLREIRRICSETSIDIGYQKDGSIPKNQFDVNYKSEVVSLCDEIYRQVSGCIFDKFRFIERKYNDIMHERDKCALRDLNLHFDTDEEDYMKTSTPYISRIDEHIMETYVDTRLAYETMYTEYLASLPEFKDSMYFKEITDTPDRGDSRPDAKIADKISTALATIFNKIMSFIKSAIDKIVGFVRGKSVQNAIKWVNDNMKTLNNMNIKSDAQLMVLPYKQKISAPISNLKNKLSSFNTSQVDTPERMTKFIEGLYPDSTVYGWFTGQTGGQKVNAEIAYQNYVLFNENGKVYLDEVKPVAMNAAMIKQTLPRWIDDVVHLGQTTQQYSSITQDLVNRVNNIKSILANMKTNDAANQQTPDKSSMYTNFANDLMKTLNNLWVPISSMVVNAVLNEYKYIQYAYANRQQ